MKAFADDKIHATEKLKSTFGRVENIVGKKRKCWIPILIPFSTMFLRATAL